MILICSCLVLASCGSDVDLAEAVVTQMCGCCTRNRLDEKLESLVSRGVCASIQLDYGLGILNTMGPHQQSSWSETCFLYFCGAALAAALSRSLKL